MRGGRRGGRPGAPRPAGATGENDIAEVRRERAAPSPAGKGREGKGAGGPGAACPRGRAGPGPLRARSPGAAGPRRLPAAGLAGKGLPRPTAAPCPAPCPFLGLDVPAPAVVGLRLQSGPGSLRASSRFPRRAEPQPAGTARHGGGRPPRWGWGPGGARGRLASGSADPPEGAGAATAALASRGGWGGWRGGFKRVSPRPKVRLKQS